MQRAPGNGLSKKARQRRNRRQTHPTNTVTTVTTRKSTPTTTVNIPRQVQNTRRSNVARPRRRTEARVNPYLEALADPENCLNCKIPDPTCVPTGTFKTIQLLPRAANDDGIIGIVFAPGWQVLNGGTYTPGVYLQTTTGSSNAAISYNTPTALNGMLAAGTIYDYIRVVSASITAEFTGSSYTDNGTATALWNKPQNATLYPINTADALLQAPYSETYPVRNGARILWRPADNDDLEFMSISATPNPGSQVRPEIGIICTGMTAGQTVMFTITVNWEGIPSTTSTSLVQATASPNNVDWLSQGIRWGQNITNMIRPMFGNNGPFQMAAQQIAGSLARNVLTNGNFTKGVIGRMGQLAIR